MSDTILAVENVSKRFAGRIALDDVSIDVARGSITGVIGPNGSGKSTLFNIIAGTLRPDEGRVLVGARDITRASAAEICEARLGAGAPVLNEPDRRKTATPSAKTTAPARMIGRPFDFVTCDRIRSSFPVRGSSPLCAPVAISIRRVPYRQARVSRSGSTASPMKLPAHHPTPGFSADPRRERSPESTRPAPRRVVEPISPVDISGTALAPPAAESGQDRRSTECCLPKRLVDCCILNSRRSVVEVSTTLRSFER